MKNWIGVNILRYLISQKCSNISELCISWNSKYVWNHVYLSILINSSLLQSQLNFCFFIWGFAAKSNIEKLLTVQKKALRTVMPGYVQYYYEDGITPAHTNLAFKEYNILTVHSLIAKNAILLISKMSTYNHH